ncbi:MAG TPA: CHAT domain-containing protein [Candidatus Angelobacter sp.]|nr:CHAT domain-containing protein [Candidatus Angelobacter sp.]
MRVNLGANGQGAKRVSVKFIATSELMARFYKSMEQNQLRPAAALRPAQVQTWKQKQWRSPYYWAAFQLQGEWR